MKVTKADRDEAIAKLREWIKPGDTVYTILESVSRSGMSREIRVLVPYTIAECSQCRREEDACTCPREADGMRPRLTTRIDFMHPNHAVSLALGIRQGKRDGLVVGGCGMDMGFHLVYSLSRVLFADGFPCTGPHCPSNDHSNGDRDYTPGRRHSDPGYAIRHRWL